MNRRIRLTENELTDLVHRILESKNKHVCCERCDWEWDITAEDEDPYLCHMCGHRNDTESKKRVSEQDDDEPIYVNAKFVNDNPFEKKKSDLGPIKIIYDKLLNKEFVANEEDLEVHYIFGGFSPGEKYRAFYGKEDQLEMKYISGDVVIKKVIFKGQDVTELVRRITSNGGWTKNLVKDDAWDRLRTISKNLGMDVGQIRVTFY